MKLIIEDSDPEISQLQEIFNFIKSRNIKLDIETSNNIITYSSLKKLKVKDLIINFEKMSLKINDNRINLTDKEFKMLCIMAYNPNIPISKRVMLKKIWKIDSQIKTRTVDTHILTLRTKLGAEYGSIIKNAPKQGYYFDLDALN